jgi:hypothetical protein
MTKDEAAEGHQMSDLGRLAPERENGVVPHSATHPAYGVRSPDARFAGT